MKQLAQRGLAGALERHGGKKDVARAILFVADMSLLLQHPQQRPDSGVAGGIGELVEHLRGARAARAVDHVHDLAFTAAELGIRFFRHCQSLNG